MQTSANLTDRRSACTHIKGSAHLSGAFHHPAPEERAAGSGEQGPQISLEVAGGDAWDNSWKHCRGSKEGLPAHQKRP